MKAIISELWETGIDIITTESDWNEIHSIKSLGKCDNIIIGEKSEYGTEVLIDDLLVEVLFRTVSHPTGLGKLRICQIN